MVAKQKTTKKKPTKKAMTTKKATKKVAKKKVTEKVTKTKEVAVAKSSPPTPAKPKAKRRRGMSVAEAARNSETDASGFVMINGRRVRVIFTPQGKKKKKRTKQIKTIAANSSTKRTMKTTLSAKELRDYRDRLMKYRASLLIDLGAIESEALNSNSDCSHMPIHMADVGSDAYDQDLKLGMAASERERIRDIEDALVRIRKKTYGVCQLTGTPIPVPRLRAKPWAKYTKEAAEKVERQNRRTC